MPVRDPEPAPAAPPTPEPAPIRGALDRAGHLAAWPLLYVIGVILAAADLSGSATPGTAPLAAGALIAWAMYVLDRVKLRSGWAEPADAINQPARARWVGARARPLRAIAFAGALGACVIGGVGVDPLAALYPPASMLCVLAYAGRATAADGVRGLKRAPGLKALVVGLGLTLLATGLAGLGLRTDGLVPDAALLRSLLPGLALLITADTIVCDLDDEPGDRASGTPTLPAALGRLPAAVTGGAVSLVGAALVWTTPGLDATRGALWLLPWCASAVAIGLVGALARRRVRDMIDARLMMIALIAVSAPVSD